MVLRHPKLELKGPVVRPTGEELFEWALYYLSREVVGTGSKHTERAKVNDLRLFLGFLKERFETPLVQYWTRAVTSEFVNRASEVYAVSTVNRVLATLSGFAQFLEKSGLISYEENPVRKVRGPKREPLQPRGVRAENFRTGELVEAGEAVFEKMLRTALEIKDRFRLRNAAVIGLLYHTGMRVEELTSLKFSQLDLPIDGETGWIRDVKCKGHKIRNVFLNKEARKLLVSYLESPENPKGPYVFCSKSKKRLHQSDVWRIVNRIATLTAQKFYPQGTVIKVHPHSFRHERAYNLLRKTNMGDSFVAEQLGHSSPNYVARYTKRTEQEIARILKDI